MEVHITQCEGHTELYAKNYTISHLQGPSKRHKYEEPAGYCTWQLEMMRAGVEHACPHKWTALKKLFLKHRTSQTSLAWRWSWLRATSTRPLLGLPLSCILRTAPEGLTFTWVPEVMRSCWWASFWSHLTILDLGQHSFELPGCTYRWICF